MNENLHQWAVNWFSTFRTLVHAAVELQGQERIPGGGTAEERVAILGELMEILGLQFGTVLEPAKQRASELQHAMEQGARQIENQVRAMIANIDREIGRALQDLRGDDPSRRFILTQDFARTGTGTFYNSTLLAFGLRNSLRPDHWLLEEFKLDDCYLLDGEPVIILGLPSTAVDARGRLLRSWYPVEVARDFTQRVVRRRKADEERRKQEEQEQARLAQERWAASAAAKEATRKAEVDRLQARIAELERQLAPSPNGTGGAA